ncbi:tail protein X [Brevibacillus porteri]|nr:tail protein X [Brevibacillus porteri]MED1803023.1 tail protein X [Brevibacillus porteri]MED2135131.1 tail protein X [Brevibacillus porteri]MED2745773.1 tail protein X [Brevibacillus porteri]MED2813763.1 tail protein X [Brevibacillus porteri]MED2897771.1 tail protein X [Brevibacillus porteri]
MTKTYNTIQGDMWDTIAYKTLGSEYHMTALIDAKPKHRETVIFSGGITLAIPEIAEPEPETLPPWKRGGD